MGLLDVRGSHIVTTGTFAYTGLLPWGLPQIGGPNFALRWLE
jgi:hypothetical protein